MFLLDVAQAVTANMDPAVPVAKESYFYLILKGGWVMLPIALLSLLAIYYIIERWMVIKKAGKSDSIWLSRIVELISEGKSDAALKFCFDKPNVVAKVASEALKVEGDSIHEVEEIMQLEARQQISKLENHMNYLGIIASIAPMLGFLGTIFGVITIFYNISQTTDLDIATISDGLYQKMICSGAGLLVGIVAYSGFYVLNGWIDKIVVNLDKDSNEVLRAIRTSKKIGS